ncbi:histidine kinase [Methylopila jiangsuensis]|uniref:histidine kinase n=1 Tax=Methylopila jiangsuensis TaxID=586230 RepID=A0A9W6N5G5_9HYPH|nr:HAMP domain-containing sensor histidine kinase [Methylopila jiangsuensis]MDR6284408.1 signal transduction histidine kinase [Methylopila jiangsuensis]GLK78207.1 histidine kinase [Methylopila jiangsuensis]
MLNRLSLRLRLVFAGLASVGLALVAAFFGLSLLFERHVERRVAEELTLHLNQVIAGLGRDGGGALDVLRPLVDPRFERPLSGLYWQVASDGGVRRSRSLWDATLTLPDPPGPAPLQTTIAGPGGAPLLLVLREVVTDRRLGSQRVTAAVAIDRSDITRATADFRRDLLPYLALLALLLLAASAAQIAIGLRPLTELRLRIARIRSGASQRLGSDFPKEVQPLTSEVDALLQSREEQLRKARERAADLAHRLKTPLQALAGDVLRLRAAGQAKAADDIDGLIATMRRLVDHEMARARIADRDRRARTDPAKAMRDVVSVLRRTPRGEELDWTIEAPDDLRVDMDADDLAELLGVLTENAARYGRLSVRLAARRTGREAVIVIEDDGAGVPPDKLANVLKRGERLDTTSGGAGLGLSIASSLAEAAGGALALENRVSGGLRVTLRLPLSPELEA